MTEASWLASLPLLTEDQRERVAAAYRQALMFTPMPALLLQVDGRIIAANQQFETLTGFDEADLHGRSVVDLAHEPDQGRVAEVLGRLSRGDDEAVTYEARWVRADGHVLWTRRHVMRVENARGGPAYFVAIVEDVTDERLAQYELQALVEIGEAIAAGAPLSDTCGRLATLAEHRWSRVGVVVTTVDEADATLHPIPHAKLPPDYVEALGPVPVGPAGMACGNAVWRGEPVAVRDLLATTDNPRYKAVLTEWGIASAWSVPLRTPEGRISGSLALFHHEPADPTDADWRALRNLAGIAALALYVDARKQVQQQELRELRRHGPTGLPNALALVESLAGACRSADPVTVAVLRLRNVGDVYALGASAGDVVLRALAERAREVVGCDTVHLADPTSLAVAVPAAWTVHDALRVRRSLARRLSVGSVTLRPDVAIGIASKRPAETVEPEDLLRHATLAVPVEGGVGGFDAAVAARHAARMELGAEVESALRTGEVVVHYQPQFDLTTGEVSGAEALARWQHPQRGLLAPGAFLPAVEAVGAGADLALHVVRRVVADAPRLHELGLPGPVAVNVTADDLRTPALMTVLVDEAAAIAPQVAIELTESALADPDVVAALERLAALGYSIALDDFGTGYSSLAAIHTMPLSVVKLDRSFTSRLPGDLAVEGLVAAVASMCRHLGITVTAEGVETEQQAAAVRRLGCGKGQGYFFGRPGPVDELAPAALVDRVPAGEPDSPVTVTAAAAHLMQRLRGEGASLHTIAAALNRAGFRSSGGTRWHARSVALALGEQPAD